MCSMFARAGVAVPQGGGSESGRRAGLERAALHGTSRPRRLLRSPRVPGPLSSLSCFLSASSHDATLAPEI